MKYIKKFYRRAVVSVLLCTVVASAAVLPKRLDLFDASENKLMFITFEYENGRNVSRTIYMADSTFVRKVMITRNADGAPAKEVSFNFNDDTSYVTSYQYSGTAAQVKIVDQFKMDQIGGTVNYSSSAKPDYELTFQKTGAIAAGMKYEKDSEGNLNKVSVFDKSGKLQYYGLFTNDEVGVMQKSQNTRHKSDPAILKTRGPELLELQLSLEVAGEVRCELITLSGRSAAVLFAARAGAGQQKLQFHVNGNERQIAKGVYLLTVSIDGKMVVRQRYLHQNGVIGGGR
jgi:hypothetical protein